MPRLVKSSCISRFNAMTNELLNFNVPILAYCVHTPTPLKLLTGTFELSPVMLSSCNANPSPIYVYHYSVFVSITLLF